MKKKRGFTLIELLAVIVILAIIALIATPIVMNVIENARKGAAQRSIENYVRTVDTAIMAEKMNGTVSDGVYTVTSTGDLCLGEETTCDKPIEVGVNGDAPKSGSKIAIENNKVVQALSTESSQKTTVSVGDYTVEYNGEGKLEATKEENTSELKEFEYDFNSDGNFEIYYYEEGMNWGQFVNSSYNTDNMFRIATPEENAENSGTYPENVIYNLDNNPICIGDEFMTASSPLEETYYETYV